MPRTQPQTAAYRQVEMAMKKNLESERDTPVVTIRAKVLWSAGPFVVVRATFPQGFIRALTSKKLKNSCDVNRAKQFAARIGTTEPAYALCPAKYVLDDENEYGEVSL